MVFSINRKIEEIRQKPEHIRMRYVWACVAVSMVFIFGIWIFSVQESFKAVNFDQSQLPDLGSEMPDLKENIPSITDLEKSLEQNDTAKEGFASESISDLKNDPDQK